MKKFLSMALALVMTMSLVVVGAGAKDFTDDSKINYDEAVSVISACGIIDGYTDGSFNPTGTLTRGAAAKIICNMILGPTTADALSADAAPFKDVPANHVFAGYIAYCAQRGIINGYADGTFKPAGTVTGYQFMKMLLGALGYEGKYEGYTGANWSINVAKQALNLELEDGNDNFVGTKAVTREEACLYAFNTLKATMVEYDENTQITVGDVVINTTSKSKEVETPLSTAKRVKIWDTETVQFAEKYFDKLDGESKSDDFGRPGTKWYYDGDSIGTYADSADEEYVMVKTDKVSLKDVLVKSDYMNLDEDDFADKITVYENGNKITDSKKISELTGDDFITYAGDQIEVFEQTVKTDEGEDDLYATVVIIRYTAAEIDDIDDELSSTDTKKGATYAIDLKDFSDEFDSEVDGDTFYDDHDDKAVLNGFDAKTYTEGTVLAIVPSHDESEDPCEDILGSSVAESVTGVVSVYKSGSKASITVDGTAYPMNGYAVANSSFKFEDMDFDGDKYTIYLDPNGYVIGIDGDTTSLEDVYYVASIGVDEGRYTRSYSIYAQAVSLKDGTVEEFKLDKDVYFFEQYKSAKATIDAESLLSTEGKATRLYSFDEDDGVYTADMYDGDGDYDVKLFNNEGVEIERGDSNIKMSTGDKYYFTENTTFVKVEDSGDDIDVKLATESTNVDTTGEDITGKLVVVVSDENGKSDEVVYMVIAASDMSNTGSADDVVYFNDTVNRTNTDGRVALAYFMDGTGSSEDITIDNNNTGDYKSSNLKHNFFRFTVDDDGIYTLHNDAKDLTVAGACVDKTYDDETGYVKGAVLTNLTKNALSAYVISGGDYKFYADDVDLSDKVLILEGRDDDPRDESKYTSKITSDSKLSSAIKKDDCTVVADLFFDDEEVIMIAVRYVTPKGENANSYFSSDLFLGK